MDNQDEELIKELILTNKTFRFLACTGLLHSSLRDEILLMQSDKTIFDALSEENHKFYNTPHGAFEYIISECT